MSHRGPLAPRRPSRREHATGLVIAIAALVWAFIYLWPIMLIGGAVILVIWAITCIPSRRNQAHYSNRR